MGKVIEMPELFVEGCLPEYWEEGRLSLLEKDKILASQIVKFGKEYLSYECVDPFGYLIYLIVQQQISGRASQQLWHRFIKLCPNPEPGTLSRKHRKSLRDAGFSERKIDALYATCKYFDSSERLLQRWKAETDEKIIQDLVSLCGVGLWSAQMFLIFGLRRPDVFPMEDAFLVQALQPLYFQKTSFEALSFSEKHASLERISASWRPWRTVAVCYLWQIVGRQPPYF